MNTAEMQRVMEAIRAYDKIVLFRHNRPDGDAEGAALGLREMIRCGFPHKTVRCINDDFSDSLSFLFTEDGKEEPDFYRDALGIAVDTATVDRISNQYHPLCAKLIKIDHHIETVPYGDIRWCEPSITSACEMIVALGEAYREELPLSKTSATYLFCGMVTDSGRFRFYPVTPASLRRAADLLEYGIDTDWLYANLYMQDYDLLKLRAVIYNEMKRTENGVTYLVIDRKTIDAYHLTHESAGNLVNDMDAIRGGLIWMIFIENEDGSYRVRLRSRFVTINKLAEKYRGGGHACACGATLYSKAEIKDLLDDADRLMKNYKDNHQGWL